jgi:undecaprenyl-diphosphatase
MRPSSPRLGETVLLGLLQGPAELLPVSSSAHVGMVPWALRWEHARLPGTARKEVEVALHLGTAAALLLGSGSSRWGFLAAASLPPAVAGLVFERAVEARLGTPPTVAAGLVLGGVAMAVADRLGSSRSATDATVADGAWLGLAQAFALVPGVSRSGATRAMARARGFDRTAAAALSREVALPVLLGATMLKAARRPPLRTVRVLGAGAAAAAGSSAAALRLERVADVSLAAWAAYRVAAAAAILAVWARRRR